MRDLSGLYAVLASDPSPVLNLQRFRRITDGTYTAVFSGSQSNARFNFNAFDKAVNNITDSKFSIVEGSLFEIENTHLPMYRCILASNTESKTYTENMEGFTCVNANVFSDPDDNLWRLVGATGNQHLVQVSVDNYDSILEEKLQRNRVVADVAEVVQYEDGDYLLFMNAVTARLDYGFAVVDSTGDWVLPRSNPAKLQRILPDQVLEAAYIDKITDSNGVATAKGPASWKQEQIGTALTTAATYNPNAYIEYMRSLYGNTPFYKALEKAIKERGIR